MIKYLFLIISILYSSSFLAQEMGSSPAGQKDFQLWIDAGLNYKVNKKFDLLFEAAYRRENNLTEVNENYIEVQAQTDPLKFLVLSGGYRLSGWYDEALVSRLFAYAKFEFEADRFRFQYRIRYDYNFSGEIDVLPANLRNKLKVKYRTRKFPIDPYIAYEVFFRTNYEDRRFSQQRLDAGLDYSIDKKQGISLYYRYQQQLNAVAPKQNYILGISYSIDL